MPIYILILLGGFLSTAVIADPGDTLVVSTFVEEFINWADAHTGRFAFPANGIKYSRATLQVLLGCPRPPGDCDPWDRLALLHVLVPTSDSTHERYEIARFITPYDITGGGRPGTCGWNYDVTGYQTLLHDSVTLSLYITTWIGGNRGWLVTATFELIEGQPDPEPYRVVNLWDAGYLVYGDPQNPPASHLPLGHVATDALTQYVLTRITCTGHGQGNTDNAAEFSNRWHRISVGSDVFQHQLWRDNCAGNRCSPQGGTWEYDRAGWCPGASVTPWDNPTSNFTPGDSLACRYEIEPYENLCRPSNPDCQDGITCPDCDYNSTGHTEPNYCLMGQAILYRAAPIVAVTTPLTQVPGGFALHQNYPNPFNSRTRIQFAVSQATVVRLSVCDIAGREVVRLVDAQLTPGEYRVNFDGSRLAGGLYFCRLTSGNTRLTRKMLLIR